MAKHIHTQIHIHRLSDKVIRISLLMCLLLFSMLLSAQQPEATSESREKTVLLYFRWDKDELHRDYMDNEQTLQEIDRLFSSQVVLREMDSVVIRAFASPEGNYIYNQKLSERRVKTIVRFLQGKFPLINTEKIKAYGQGENWEGLRRMVEADKSVPEREAVLRLIDSSVLPNEKERRLRLIGGGAAYRYIEQHILRYLRTGATFVLLYPKALEYIVNPDQKEQLEPIEPKISLLLPLEPEIPVTALPLMEGTMNVRYIRPFALKTNLLFNAATLFNIELEVPLGKRFSILGEWTFPWWGGLGNRGGVSPVPVYSEEFTMQMLSGGLEGRYWFPRNGKLNDKAQRWGDYNALNGWFVGIYGGAGVYDFQFNSKGMQGEFYIAAGISGGYAHPIGKFLHMEYSLGVGYLSTEYYNYKAMDGHKVVDILPNGQYDRRKQTWIGPTKVKVSLVWTPRFKVKNRR